MFFYLLLFTQPIIDYNDEHDDSADKNIELSKIAINLKQEEEK